MPQIQFEGYITDYENQYYRLVVMNISGVNRAEIEKAARVKAKELGMDTFTAVAIHNKKADWIQVFGEPKGECAFGDHYYGY